MWIISIPYDIIIKMTYLGLNFTSDVEDNKNDEFYINKKGDKTNEWANMLYVIMQKDETIALDNISLQ